MSAAPRPPPRSPPHARRPTPNRKPLILLATAITAGAIFTVLKWRAVLARSEDAKSKARSFEAALPNHSSSGVAVPGRSGKGGV